MLISGFAELLAVYLFCFGIVAVKQIQSNSFGGANLPWIFAGRRGGIFLLSIQICILLGGLSMAVWSFTSMPWYIATSVLLITPSLSWLVFPYMPLLLQTSALGPIFSASALILINLWAWSR